MDNQIPNSKTTEHIEITPQANKVVRDLGHDKLLSCLYFLFDAMERAQLDFFLVKQTAHEAMSNQKLSGDHITIGLRNNQWASDAKDILFSFFEQERVDITNMLPTQVGFSWQDIPFTLYLYDDCEPLLALNTIAYEYESWHIPNQFERFEKEFDNI